MTSNKLPGPAGIRQHMYMFPEKYAKDKDGNKIKIKKIDVVLFGGAAGSGKSEIGVIDFLKYADIPNFVGIMTRRTTPQLTGPGGLLSKCKRIFSQSFAPDEYYWRAMDKKFVFRKSGAEIYLRHFENDQADINWQGIEGNLFYIDESTQYTQHMIQYIMSRMRNPNCPQVKPHLKMTCNPDADHFLQKWVLPYLREDGTPDRTKDGWVRYFTFMNGEFVWADSKEQLVSSLGIDEKDALSFTFISANVFDNPVMSKVNPKYVSWLKGLSGVEKARLLDGNWLVREQGATFFQRQWCQEIPYVDSEEISSCVRVFDFAATLKSDREPSPDYTASVRMVKTKDGEYVVDDVVRTRVRPGDWLNFVLDCTARDPENTTVYIPQDPGAAAKRAIIMFARELSEHGLYVKRIGTNKSKLDRFRPFSSMAQNGGIKFVSNCGTDLENNIQNDLSFVYRELEAFTGQRKRGEAGHDDVVDCMSDAFYALASEREFVGNISSGLATMSSEFRNTSNFPV